MKTTYLSNNTIATKSSRPMRQLCGLAIAALAAIGLSAPLASAVTVPVINGNFETEFGTNTDPTLNWAKIPSAPWSFENGNTGLKPIAGNFSSDPDGGSNFTRFTWNNAGVEQNLQTTVSAGDTLSVTFNLGVSLGAWDLDRSRVRGNAYFKVGSTYYKMPYDLSLPATPATGVWYPFTFTTTITNSGNLSIGFQNLSATNTYYTSLNSVSDVTLTPAANDPNAPTSTNATLVADENVSTALAAGDFGYADPNSSPLAAVQITAVPTLGTLTYNGNPVSNNDIIAAANIGNLSYLSPLGGFGSPYTTIGIKVQNSALPTGLWSLPATMTVNVTDVNHPPTSSGGSVVMGKNTVKTFAAADFPFSDIDAGNTLQAIKVTSLPNPTNGTLNLSGTPITLDQVVAVADITAGNLTYTPVTDYTGSDPFNFQVRDAALFSADATMAISVTSDIIVQNGSFETRALPNNASYWWALGSPWVGGISPQGYEVLKVNEFNTFTAAADGLYAANLESWLVSVTQDLSTTVNAGDTLSMTFSGGRAKTGQGGGGSNGGKFTATFMVGTTEYTSIEFDTTLQLNDTWQSYTFTTPITNTGNLSIIFRPVSGRPWLDKVSNVSVTSGGGGFANWAPAGGQTPGEDYNNDGVQNGIAYFMNATGQATLPGLIDNTVTWTNGGNIPSADYGTQFAVETSPDLENWTPVDENDPNLSNTAGTVSYILTPGLDQQFVRLVVTPN